LRAEKDARVVATAASKLSRRFLGIAAVLAIVDVFGLC
jgi:hypothetical protein